MATNPREELIRAVSQAKDQAKSILAALEQQGHPQTNESNGVYFGLVTIVKLLRALEPNVDLALLARELEQVAGLCICKLVPFLADLRVAVRVSRGGS